MSLRDTLNKMNPNRMADAFRALRFGDVLNLLLGKNDAVVAALTSSQNATAAANAQGVGYVQADVQSIATLANALQVSYNAAQVDIAALRTAILAMGAATESGLVVTANKTTLANFPSAIINVVATAGGATGVKTLLVGPLTGPKAIVPQAGQVAWDGGKTLLFAVADAVTTAQALYTRDADTTASVLARDIGQQDAPV